METILMALAYYSKTCEIVHAAMARLLAVGLLDARGMQEFDLLCLNDKPQAEAAPATQNARPDATMIHGLRALA
jgi:hypothetical protein